MANNNITAADLYGELFNQFKEKGCSDKVAENNATNIACCIRDDFWREGGGFVLLKLTQVRDILSVVIDKYYHI